ncbi:GNAT family N-acetyltransferase [Streptomyces sp. NPDC055109]
MVGHVLLSARRLDARRRIVNVLTLSLLGVLPEFQRQGVGTQLVSHALEAADGQGVPPVFLEGSPRYYVGRGFEGASAAGFRSTVTAYPRRSLPGCSVVRVRALDDGDLRLLRGFLDV